MTSRLHSIHCVIPPYVLEQLARASNARVREAAMRAIAQSAALRQHRTVSAAFAAMAATPSPGGKKTRLVYDAKRKPAAYLPGKLVRSEGDPRAKDPAVNEAYDNAGATYDFYATVLGRNSLDGKGMTLISSVHLGNKFNNAFWNGEQMAYGDGDGRIFVRFTKGLDVVGHELSHGVVSHTCDLEYLDEPGALNESYADVMGTLIKQWKNDQTVKQADWLIGPDIMGPDVKARALRSLTEEPAYVDDPLLGSDPQPKHMKHKYKGTDDEGGVHINSGIPNHAFYLAAREIGGRAWEKCGRIWYHALLALDRRSQFADAAEKTIAAAGALFGSPEMKAVRKAWKGVGL